MWPRPATDEKRTLLGKPYIYICIYIYFRIHFGSKPVQEQPEAYLITLMKKLLLCLLVCFDAQWQCHKK